jgi:hypothetical protein
MKKNEYTILKRQIPDVNLHSETGTFWFDTEINDWKSWYSASVPIDGMVPSSNDTGSLHLVRDIKWYPDITYTGSVVLFYSGKTYQSLTGSNLNNIPSGSVYWKEVEQTAINNTKGKYYKWDGDNWNLVIGTGTTSEEIIIDFNRQINQNYTIPIALEASADEMGVMVSFDGNVEQVEQLINFTYKQSGSVVTVYNTVNPNKLRKIIDQEFTIDWGDGYTSGLTVNSGVLYSNFPNSGHTYSTTGSYTLSLSLDSPWSKEKINKNITVPNTGSIVTNPLGTFTGFTLPGNIYYTGSDYQNYLNDLDYTNNTGSTIIKYMAIGGSKIGELKRYGETTLNSSMYTTGMFSGSAYTGYTLEPSAIVSGSLVVSGIPTGSLWYMDFADGYTMITGATSNFTREDVINNVITRNEHFLGFIDDPTVYSDIFVERGRQGVMEVNLRLGEIDNMSELDIYGNGFFKVKKQ